MDASRPAQGETQHLPCLLTEYCPGSTDMHDMQCQTVQNGTAARQCRTGGRDAGQCWLPLAWSSNLQSNAPVEGGATLQVAASATIAATGAITAVATAVDAASTEHAAPRGRAATAPVPDEVRLLLHYLQLHVQTLCQ